jgi:ribonucleotide monophosphatase NagD (HAD superfamily)
MIGDDLEADAGGAKAAACTGVMVRAGKFHPSQLEKSEIVPDAILDSLAGAPRMMDIQ